MARMCATRSRSTCSCADFAAPARRPPSRVGARQSAPQAGAVHLVADRPRPRPARRGDRRRAAQAAPRSRDRLARPAPGHHGAGGARRAHPPGQRLAGQRVRRTSSPSRPSTTCTPSRRSAGWTRSSSPTSWCSTTWSARRPLRPVDRRRGLGPRLLPAREPRAEAGRLRLDDRLRRLAADARRRRAGGVPDRRLQRRDDRAHRPLPAGARPRDLRRRRPTTSSPTPSARTCR